MNDRVIGGMTPNCSEAAVSLYKSFVQGECFVTTVRIAEMCKLTENSFRDVNIAFANELSMICDEQGINVWELIRLANRHPRVNILQPGCGVGGHCIAVDPWFIVDSAPTQAKLIRAAREVNDAKPEWVVRQIEEAIEGLIRSGMAAKDICIAFLGIAYKANIDDLRESPALAVVEAVTAHHKGRVVVVEPNREALPDSLVRAEVFLMNLEEAVSRAHLIILLVDHAAFKGALPKLSSKQVLIDTRGIWSNAK